MAHRTRLSSGRERQTVAVTRPNLRRTFPVLLTLLVSGACNEEPSAPTLPATLRVVVSTAGAVFDPDGYRVLAGGEMLFEHVDLNERRTGSQPTLGSQDIVLVELTDVAENCSVAGGAAREVAFDPTTGGDVAFEVTCVAPADLALRRLAFLSDGDVYAGGFDGSPPSRLTQEGNHGNLAVAAQRDRLAFTNGAGVHAMDTDGANRHTLWTEPGEIAGLAWAPDGSRMAYVAGDGWFTAQIRLRTLSTGDEVGLAPEWGMDLFPSWSPDGTRIAFTRVPWGELPTIQTLDPDGGDTPELVGVGRAPVWAPRAEALAFSDTEGRLRVVTATGGTASRISPGIEGLSLRATDWSDDGSWILMDGAHGEGGIDVYVLSVLERRISRITTDGSSKSGHFVAP